jgi:hypothetical protein
MTRHHWLDSCRGDWFLADPSRAFERRLQRLRWLGGALFVALAVALVVTT